MRGVLAAAILATAMAGGARAQEADAGADLPAPDTQDAMRLCRAAALYEREAAPHNRVDLPRRFSESLAEQIDFIIFRNLIGAAPQTAAATAARVRQIESAMLTFSRSLRQNRESLADRDSRRRILLDCQPLVWTQMKEKIDALMAAQGARE